jgi:hypothetical protein
VPECDSHGDFRHQVGLDMRRDATLVGELDALLDPTWSRPFADRFEGRMARLDVDAVIQVVWIVVVSRAPGLPHPRVEIRPT